MRLHVDVVVWRGAIAESRHRVQVAVCDADGTVALATETADLVTTLRSAAKPFQLVPLVERGHADRWGWSDEQLAVMAASHTGSPYHIGLVRGILECIGCTERDLACGYHDPLDAESRARLATHADARTSIYNNCSGKHAGMLCLARSEGRPIAGYEHAGHPVQQLMTTSVAECCGLEPTQLAVAIDGCSVCVFALPLLAMARGFARLASAKADDGDPRARALARIRAAMTQHAMAVGGEGRLSTALMQATGGRLVAKGGAEGLECIGMSARGLGMALKCEDGETRAVSPAIVAVLDHLGELSAAELERLAPHRRPELSNHAGVRTGSIEAVVRALVTASS